jgi:cytochrome c biogenesis protein CcdA
VLPVLAALSAVAVAVVGALLTGSGIGSVNSLVEGLSGRSGSALGNASDLLPLSFAFGAGMVSTVNPCGFAMLPAYLGLYLGDAGKGTQQVSRSRRLVKALTVGGVVTGGFIILFGITGVLIGAGLRSVISVFPWIGLGVGVALTVGAAWLLRGGTLYSGIAERAAARVGKPDEVNIRGYFLFGVSYGTASLSCTLPIFLVVVSSTLAVSGIVAAIGQFIVYALGMGLVIIALTVGMGLFQRALVGTLRKSLAYIQPVSAVFMLVAGAYIIYYWLTIGELLERIV